MGERKTKKKKTYRLWTAIDWDTDEPISNESGGPMLEATRETVMELREWRRTQPSQRVTVTIEWTPVSRDEENGDG